MAHRTPTSSGCKQVGESAVVTTLNGSIEVPQNGYVYIYTSNETKNIDVYFDELQVTHTRGALLEEMSYYPFGGQIAGLHSKAAGGLQSRAGFQGQEYEEDLGIDLYAFEARQYDAQIGRWHVPDPRDQFHSPYGAMGNNPVAHVDPDGRFVWLAIAIGAIIGRYSGYQVGKAQGTKGWDMAGYILGGAFVGGVSAGAGAAISSSGIAFSQTLALSAGSAINSAGMQLLSGGQTDFTVSLGIASYNFSKGELGYLGKKGNSFLENFGYGLGALANIQDALAGFHPQEVQLQTENVPEGSGKDLIGHSQVLDKDGNSLIDFGPKEAATGSFVGFSPARNDWMPYSTEGSVTQVKNLSGNIYNQSIPIKGVNLNTLTRISNRLNANAGSYNFLVRSCSSVASRSLIASGVFVMGGIHPYLLRTALMLRNAGLRPSLFSYYLNQ